MAAFKTLIILFLLSLATNGLAGRIFYATKYHGIGLNGNQEDKTEKKAGGRVDDANDEVILSKIGSWSGGKYKASKHPTLTIITVTSDTIVQNKDAATSANQDMQHTVVQGLRNARSPSPGPSGSKSPSGKKGHRSLDYAFQRRDLDYDFERRDPDSWYDFERRGLDDYNFELVW